MVCSKSDPIGIVGVSGGMGDVDRFSRVPVIAVLVVGERELMAVSAAWSSTLDLFKEFAVRTDVIPPTVRRSRMGWPRNRAHRRVAVLRSGSESAELASKLEFFGQEECRR